MVKVVYRPYCVKCRHKVDPKSPKIVKLSNGRKALRGTCPHCATKVTRILADSDTAKTVGL